MTFPCCSLVRFVSLIVVSQAVGSAMAAHPSTLPPTDRAPVRLLVLSDIEADPDDTQSFVRLFLYANEIEIQGLVATTSTWKQTSIAPDSITALIQVYGIDRPSLVRHDPAYPTAEELLSRVRSGRAEYGMKGVGPGKDTPGSDLIIRLLDQPDDRPLWVAVWGGANTLAQALHTLQATRSPAEVEQAVSRLRVHTISDQDDAGPWIRQNFPELFYIVAPGGNYGGATWTGINRVVDGIDNTTISNGWIADHIQQGFGALGAAYPDVAWGVEGDTPSWLGLIPNGLNTPERPDWGGWGGRYELYRPVNVPENPNDLVNGVRLPAETRPIWTNAVDDYRPFAPAAYGRAMVPGERQFKDAQATLWRWRDDFQNDFAARMAWTKHSYEEANHAPVPHLSHAEELSVKAGAGFGLDAHGSTDPDGDNLSYLWIYYPEAGTYRGEFKINGPQNQVGIYLDAPKVESRQTMHFILRVTDKGKPSLSRYKRVIVTVEP